MRAVESSGGSNRRAERRAPALDRTFRQDQLPPLLSTAIRASVNGCSSSYLGSPRSCRGYKSVRLSERPKLSWG
jgi:hypothetical protein